MSECHCTWNVNDPCPVHNSRRTEVDRVTVSQDVGGPFAVWKTVTLVLWDDGAVTWEKP